MCLRLLIRRIQSHCCLLLCRLPRPAGPLSGVSESLTIGACVCPLKISNILNIWPNRPYHFSHAGYCHPSYGPSNGCRSWPRSLATGRAGSDRGVADPIAACSVDLIFLTTILCPPYNPAMCMLSHCKGTFRRPDVTLQYINTVSEQGLTLPIQTRPD